MIFDFSYFVRYYPEFHFVPYLTGFRFNLLDSLLAFQLNQARSDPHCAPYLAISASFDGPGGWCVWQFCRRFCAVVDFSID
jgi:hypothetical protein